MHYEQYTLAVIPLATLTRSCTFPVSSALLDGEGEDATLLNKMWLAYLFEVYAPTLPLCSTTCSPSRPTPGAHEPFLDHTTTLYTVFRRSANLQPSWSV